MSQRIVSIDRAAVMLQVGMALTRGAAEAVGVEPALIINGIEHYDELDLPRLQSHLLTQAEKHRQPPPEPAPVETAGDSVPVTSQPASSEQPIEPRKKRR